jgi:hypothetical protein
MLTRAVPLVTTGLYRVEHQPRHTFDNMYDLRRIRKKIRKVNSAIDHIRSNETSDEVSTGFTQIPKYQCCFRRIVSFLCRY